jgi:exonuclease SbcC
MRLDTAKIHGFLRFENTLEIDFRTLPAGLIAFVGPIGEGKTTALETPLAVLFRQLLSRQGALVDYALARDSYLEAQFTLDGRGTFRARVNLDGVKRGQDAVIVPVLPDGTEGPALNDGKVSSYDVVIADLFPSLQLLRASAVISQDRRGSFADLDPKGRKALFGEMIGTGHYQQMSDTARAAATMVEAARGRLAAVRDTLARNTTQETIEAIENSEHSIGVEIARLSDLRVDLQAVLIRLETGLSGLQEQASKHQAGLIKRQATWPRIEQAGRDEDRARQELEEATAQHQEDLEALAHKLQEALDDLDVQLADPAWLDQELGRIDADVHVAMARLEASAADLTTLTQELQDIDDNLQDQQKDVDTRIGNNRTVLQRAPEIRAAVAVKTQAEAQMVTWRQRETALRTKARDAQTKVNDAVTHLVQIDATASQLTHLEQAVAALSGVPCHGEGQFGACRFLTDAKAAEQTIPELRQMVATRGAWEQQRDTQDAAGQDVDQGLIDVARQIRRLEQDIATANAKARLLASVETAESRIDDLKQQRRVNEQHAETARAGVHAREALRQADLAECLRGKAVEAANRREQAQASEKRRQDALYQRRVTVQAEADAEMARVTGRYQARQDQLHDHLTTLDGVLVTLRAELAAAEQDERDYAGAALAAAALQGELAAERRRWDDLTMTLATLQAEKQDVTRQRVAFEARRMELDGLTVRIETLTDEQIEWNWLAKALGRDGLQTLEIDAAGPTVSHYTNELLSVCFGARFSIDLVTQEAKAGGKGLKESFQIKVYDNERGGTARDLDALSGGEKVVVGEALANAIALYNNNRSGMQIQTLFRDETTGSLDPETAPLYVAMLRKVQQLGDVRQIFYVTHSPVAAALADAQIRFAGGTATVAWPPFREAA